MRSYEIGIEDRERDDRDDADRMLLILRHRYGIDLDKPLPVAAPSGDA